MPKIELILLTAHLVGAVGTGMIILVSLASLWRGAAPWYRRLGIGLAVVTGFQLVSGAFLSLASAQSHTEMLPLAAYRRNLALYVVVIGVVQAMLYRRMRKVAPPFPLRLALTSATVGVVVALLVGTVLYL